MTSNTEAPINIEANAPNGHPEGASKATAPRKRRVPLAKSKLAKKTTAAQKRAKTPRKAKSAAGPGPRKGSKTGKILDLLKRPSGATLKDLMKATGWQPHSVRGFLSGTVGKKLGISIVSVKEKGGERTYSAKP